MPRKSGKDIIKALGKSGFEVTRIKGSHYFLRHEDGRVTTVPLHGNETIGIRLLNKILRDVDLTHDQFLDLL